MRLDENKKEKLRTLIVEVLIAYRRQYLANGGSPLNHWDILQNRSLSAARRSGTMDQWVSLLARGLQLQAPDKGACSAILDLTTFVRELGSGADGTTLSMIRTELGLLMALTRKCAEERREQRDEK